MITKYEIHPSRVNGVSYPKQSKRYAHVMLEELWVHVREKGDTGLPLLPMFDRELPQKL